MRPPLSLRDPPLSLRDPPLSLRDPLDDGALERLGADGAGSEAREGGLHDWLGEPPDRDGPDGGLHVRTGAPDGEPGLNVRAGGWFARSGW